MANMQKMMKEMQKMQSQMQRLQEEIAQTPVEGSAGGGACTVTVNGTKEIIGIKLNPEIVDPEDIEMLEDLIVAAAQDAARNAERLTEEKMGSLTKGMKLPGGLGGLF